MIISMRPHAPKAEIDYVCERIREFGFKVHSIEGEERVVIGVVGVGGDVTACLESLEATPGWSGLCGSRRRTSSSARSSRRSTPKCESTAWKSAATNSS